MSEENLTREADSFFGFLKTKRIETVKVKLADFVKKEHNLRQKIRFQIMKAQKGEGPRGRNPPSSFELKDVTLNGFISIISRESEFKCEICGTLLLGKRTCENHLRSEHFKEFKSLVAKECSLDLKQ